MATKRQTTNSTASRPPKKIKQPGADEVEPPFPKRRSSRLSAASSSSSSSSRAARKPSPKQVVEVGDEEEEEEDDVAVLPDPENPMPDEFEQQEEEEEEEGFLEADLKEAPQRTTRRRRQQQRKPSKGKAAAAEEDEGEPSDDDKFVGEPVPDEEARRRWPDRYPTQEQKAAYARKKQTTRRNNDDDDILIEAISHFTKAEVDGNVYYLYDDAYVKAGENEPDYICKIIEMFACNDGLYFTAQWYFRTTDTVIQDNQDNCNISNKRIFYSDVTNINPLNCLLRKLKIARFGLNIDQDQKSELIEGCDYYCDTKYLIPYSTFQNFPTENGQAACDNSSTISSKVDCGGQQDKPKAYLLDMYSGCGGMSTGLCLGASLADLNLITKWAVDVNKPALETLKQNHKETEVREEAAEDFLQLLKEWKRLCVHFKFVDPDGSEEPVLFSVEKNSEVDEVVEDDAEAYDVDCIMGICYGKLSKEGKSRLLFKIRWKNYGPEDDSWEPITVLSDCEESIQKFVAEGFHANLLPLPGDAHVVCGGPPCQGFSGFNRFRNKKDPLADVKNQQIMVFLDIVQFLKPKFVLMENVVDLLKFKEGSVGRFALGRLVGMKYQARMGLMCAGAYGLPQFRMRVFYWGALPTERLPPFPLPTHDVDLRGQIPIKWQVNCVAYDENQSVKLSRKLLLKDAISDLPPVENSEKRDSMPYGGAPQTPFQMYIRRSEQDLMTSSKGNQKLIEKLYDHRPLKLNDDDYQRVCYIPKRKGANFRDLPGVAGEDRIVSWDPKVERKYLDSKKPLVPDYAMTFMGGTSTKPFGRLWWDEIVSTVVTRAEPHNQVILHPLQDRVLSVRENARLQGFPDYYELRGSIKQRYTQIGNAVAVPVARALGYALGLAYRGCVGDDFLLTLPEDMHLPGGVS